MKTSRTGLGLVEVLLALALAGVTAVMTMVVWGTGAQQAATHERALALELETRNLLAVLSALPADEVRDRLAAPGGGRLREELEAAFPGALPDIDPEESLAVTGQLRTLPGGLLELRIEVGSRRGSVPRQELRRLWSES